MYRKVIGLVLCASSLVVAAGCDEASKSSENQLAQEFTQAADALIAKVGAPGEKAEMPAATDPSVKAFDGKAQQALAALGTPALPVDGFDTFEPFCAKTANIVGAYISAGQSGAANQQEVMAKNMERYFDQLFTPLLFAAHCSAAHVPFFEETVDVKDKSKAAAFQQVRDGSYAQFSGLLELAGASDLAADQRRRAMDVLVRDAGNFAIILNQAQRRQITAEAQNVRSVVAEGDRQKIDSVIAAIGKAPCGKLCSV